MGGDGDYGLILQNAQHSNSLRMKVVEEADVFVLCVSSTIYPTDTGFVFPVNNLNSTSVFLKFSLLYQAPIYEGFMDVPTLTLKPHKCDQMEHIAIHFEIFPCSHSPGVLYFAWS